MTASPVQPGTGVSRVTKAWCMFETKGEGRAGDAGGQG
eukprot:CAMPEP_0172207712 /NCGR_PEP_ID=MMETSP1050-20130122/34004_1 /TAXON_ID=233186 /ORGANISM="Cryptomonas curvata, Strain CCAP979/52" /LENGTH=37 /DNA_ID= /DNA_START= /DNA_END= /DNA_ORIENTATION=